MSNACSPELSGRGICAHRVRLVDHCAECEEDARRRKPPPEAPRAHGQQAPAD